MKIKSEIVVLNARRYAMKDESTGELVQGTKISYIEDWSSQIKQNSTGVSVLSANLAYDDFGKFSKVPAVFDAEFQLTEGARGRAVLRLTSCNFKAPFTPKQ